MDARTASGFDRCWDAVASGWGMPEGLFADAAASDHNLVDAHTAIRLLSSRLDAIASGNGMSSAGLDQQRVRFGDSSHGWLGGSLQAALETSRIALCVWDGHEQPLPEADRPSPSAHQSRGPPVASALASTT